jgi:hypothetical protein
LRIPAKPTTRSGRKATIQSGGFRPPVGS